ncbi:MAG: ORF6N domain-containing protein [Acholeplasmatales bacterium]|nr:ORF6N domain-containing protein [Acholeplasmatales bacterium]
MNKKELDYEIIKSMIYTIRGHKVMLDFDLAKLYGYETKVFNQQVKRNIDKFQKECIFKLKNDEFLVARSQNVTAQIWATNNGGRTTLPYAFTEQGIKTLSTVLRGTNVSDITSMLLEMITSVELSTTEKWLSEANKYEIVKFESGDIILDVNVSPNEDTVWLTQNEIAILYDTTISNISMHITNIFDSNELKKDSVI